MRDFFSPVQLLCNRVPRTYFEALYSVLLPKPADHEDPNRPPTAHELLTTVAFMKGFMSSSGIPDCSRAARLILKDVVNGKLRCIAAPPGVPQEEFDQITFAALPQKKQATRTESLLLEQVCCTFAILLIKIVFSWKSAICLLVKEVVVNVLIISFLNKMKELFMFKIADVNLLSMKIETARDKHPENIGVDRVSACVRRH